MKSSFASVLIVGAGAVGLSIGWRLAQAGIAVTVLDRAEAGRQTSWAAAGMLAAGSEAEPGETALYALNRRAQALWPDFAAELHAASGIDPELRQEGTLSIALNRDEVERLRQVATLQNRFGIASTWLTGEAVREREPYLSPRVAGAVLVETDHQVDNRFLVQGLRAAFLAAGGVLREATEVLSLLRGAGGVEGVVTATGELRADCTVLAAGPWSQQLLPALPMRPIKGQMLALQMQPAQPLLRHVLWTQKSYLVPRRDGRLLVGATVEEAGFDDRVTAGGMLALLESAWRALPSVEELPLIESWVGFRPGSRDDAPILGPVEDGLVVATGHHRNGILLTPVTAQLISDWIINGRSDELLGQFGLGRFLNKAA